MIDIQLNECEIFEKTVFNRWVEAVPSEDQSAATVIKVLTREVMARFGIPKLAQATEQRLFRKHSNK